MLSKLRCLAICSTLLLSLPTVSHAVPPDNVLNAIKENPRFPASVSPGSRPSWIAEFTAAKGPVEYPYDPTMPVELTFTSEANRNIARYWNYRDNFRKNFIKLTTEQGGCLPVEEIFEFGDGPDANKLGHWGDATIKLGWYMGVLSTELHMLTALTPSGNAKEYVEYGGPNRLHNAQVELYCALLALERLDQFGEDHLWQDHPIKELKVLGLDIFGTDLLPRWPNDPGFFIRDDVDRALALGPNSGPTSGGMGFATFWSDMTPIPTPAVALPATTTLT